MICIAFEHTPSSLKVLGTWPCMHILKSIIQELTQKYNFHSDLSAAAVTLKENSRPPKLYGSLGDHWRVCNQLSPSFLVLHSPLGVGELQPCPLFDVVFPPLLLSTSSLAHNHSAGLTPSIICMRVIKHMITCQTKKKTQSSTLQEVRKDRQAQVGREASGLPAVAFVHCGVRPLAKLFQFMVGVCSAKRGTALSWRRKWFIYWIWRLIAPSNAQGHLSAFH